MPKKQPSPPPFRYGPPEKRNWLRIALFSLFVLLALAGIYAMAMSSKRVPSLVCTEYNGSGLWSAFGRCREDE